MVLYLLCCFSFSGYANALVFKEITTEDIELIEQYAKNDLPGILGSLPINNESKDNICFFGLFSTQPSVFMFLPDEKQLIFTLVNHVKKIVDETGLQHFADFERVEESGGSFMREMSHSLFGLIFSDTSEQNDGNNNHENN